MKAITEYIQKKHITYSKPISSYKDLEPGDYVAFEFEMGGFHHSGIAKFQRVGKYNDTSTTNSVVFDWAACGRIRSSLPIKLNTHNSLNGNYKITYTNPTEKQIELCKQIDDFIEDNNLKRYIGNNNSNGFFSILGYVKPDKIEWAKL